MKRFLNVLGRAVKAVVVVLVGAAIRISKGQGEGVFEKAVQNAFAEVAQSYVRSIK